MDVKEQVTPNEVVNEIGEVEQWLATAKQYFDAQDYDKAIESYSKVLELDKENWRALFYTTCCLAFTCDISEVADFIEVFWNGTENTPVLISMQYVLNLADAIPELTEYALQLEKMLNHLCDRLNKQAQLTNSEEYEESYSAKKFTSIILLHILVSNWEKIDDIRDDERYVAFALALYKRLANDPIYIKGVSRWINSDGTLNDYAKMIMDPERNPIVPMTQYIRKYEPSFCSSAEQAINAARNKYKREQANRPQPQPQAQSGGCYVATAVYGSYDCPEVWTLRRYRDDTLAKTWYGRAFIKTYYAISPTLVKWFGHTEWFKTMWRGKLNRMVQKLQNNGVENTPYEDKNW